MFGVTPAISLFGIVGNIFSIIILIRHGLNKCSNILLVVLAANDICFLIGFNSVPNFLYDLGGPVEGFAYNPQVGFFLFILHQLFEVMDYGCGAVSLTLPVLITSERLIAVFLPLQFTQIVTPRRTWCAVVIICVCWYGFFIHMSFLVTLQYEFSPASNTSIGLMRRSDYFNDIIEIVPVLELSMSYLCLKIPPVATFVGCVTIVIKVKMASVRRLKITSKSNKASKSNRTTKMLLAVCTMYTMTCGVMSLPTFLPQYMYYTMTSDAPSNLGRIMYQVMNLALCINSSWNFIIYVVMNKNFRKTYWSLFDRKKS
ncbi:unnamed protein product [Lymnaea stagnalis]|uniref:G-protein coupled receptors family 1 profile domain-containing protein n=1 Tax=Lymnaea stagnalis TaxID=6523 RepID=A0AAV2HTQ1_LYMST